LARGSSTLRGALDSEDTQVMCEGLRALGIRIKPDENAATLQVDGCNGAIPRRQAELFVGNSGTTVRFLTALCAVGRGRYRLDGVPRMRERPIQDLLDALHHLGAATISELGTGCPPVLVEANGLRGGAVSVRGDISSQFLSALMMAAPYADADVTVRLEGQLVSRPYVTMTSRVMAAFGAGVESPRDDLFVVSTERRYVGRGYAIEPDASAASYFWAAAAISGGHVTVDGLTRDTLQGDVAFCDCLERMGCRIEYQSNGIKVFGGRLRGASFDMREISDTVPTLAAVALFAEGKTTILGVSHIRHKETDRIGNLARELRKLGASVNELPDGLEITPGRLRPATVETYQDHRMAMSLALVGLRVPGIVIDDPECTAKTYPGYFRDLANTCRTNQ
jgi:3-phosphoshikimate 1-carboxyvinyltransferase